MRPYRWGKSLNAYTQWAFIFDKELPIELDTDQSALSVVIYIRDVIAFAHENNLKGAEWYKKVMVSAIGHNKILIKQRKNYTRVSVYPAKSLFELMDLHQSNDLYSGYKFYTTDEMAELAETLEALEIRFKDHGNNLVEIL